MEELARIAAEPDAFIAEQTDPRGVAAPVVLPDGTGLSQLDGTEPSP